VVVDEGLTTVAPSADVLSERGASPAKTLRADEALPLMAISVGASVIRTDERIVPADGIAAVLRNAPTLRLPVPLHAAAAKVSGSAIVWVSGH